MIARDRGIRVPSWLFISEAALRRKKKEEGETEEEKEKK